jgi:hypothetical protein
MCKNAFCFSYFERFLVRFSTYYRTYFHLFKNREPISECICPPCQRFLTSVEKIVTKILFVLNGEIGEQLAHRDRRFQITAILSTRQSLHGSLSGRSSVASTHWPRQANYMTTCTRVFLVELLGVLLVNKLLGYFGTEIFISLFTRAHQVRGSV